MSKASTLPSALTSPAQVLHGVAFGSKSKAGRQAPTHRPAAHFAIPRESKLLVRAELAAEPVFDKAGRRKRGVAVHGSLDNSLSRLRLSQHVVQRRRVVLVVRDDR